MASLPQWNELFNQRFETQLDTINRSIQRFYPQTTESQRDALL